ncbi:unnamed protein product [Mytilus coruscus]|uniref:Uncharacterized protein n=1 Tax=Mytilus coruscus TaxID=42192 RepID=A0A6J8C3B7_MYTCO|nr:unnamed protein product [Mytilus coruscus]
MKSNHKGFSTHKGGGIKYSPEKSQITENPLHFLKKLSPSMKTPLMVHPSHPYYGLLKHGERDDDDKFHDLKRVINLSDDIRRKYIETPLLGESNEDYIKKAKINRGNGGDETKPYRQVHIEPDVFNSFESRWYQQNGPDHADKFAKIANWKRNDYESNTRQTFPKYNNFQIEHTISKKNKTFNNQSLQVDMISSQGTKFSFPKSRAISERSTNIRDTNNEFKINQNNRF